MYSTNRTKSRTKKPFASVATDDTKTQLVGPRPRRRPPVREAPPDLDRYTGMAALDESGDEKLV
jgi:hypothetical protein